MTQFLTALQETFHECPRVKLAKFGWETRLGLGQQSQQLSAHAVELGTEAAIHLYNATCGHTQGIQNRDERLLAIDTDMLTSIDLWGKWCSGLDADTQDAVWEFMQALTTTAAAVVQEL